MILFGGVVFLCLLSFFVVFFVCCGVVSGFLCRVVVVEVVFSFGKSHAVK